MASVFKAACTPQRAVAVAVRFRSLPGRYGLDQDLLARRSLASLLHNTSSSELLSSEDSKSQGIHDLPVFLFAIVVRVHVATVLGHAFTI